MLNSLYGTLSGGYTAVGKVNSTASYYNDYKYLINRSYLNNVYIAEKDDV